MDFPTESLPNSDVSPTRQTQPRSRSTSRKGRGARGVRGLRLSSLLPAGTMHHIFAGSTRQLGFGLWVAYSYKANASKTKGPAFYAEQKAQSVAP